MLGYPVEIQGNPFDGCKLDLILAESLFILTYLVGIRRLNIRKSLGSSIRA